MIKSIIESFNGTRRVTPGRWSDSRQKGGTLPYHNLPAYTDGTGGKSNTTQTVNNRGRLMVYSPLKEKAQMFRSTWEKGRKMCHQLVTKMAHWRSHVTNIASRQDGNYPKGNSGHYYV